MSDSTSPLPVFDDSASVDIPIEWLASESVDIVLSLPGSDEPPSAPRAVPIAI